MGIPVVDLDSLSGRGEASASSTVADLVEAFSGIGFAFVTGHGVGLGTLAALQDLLPRVFAADQDTKSRWQIDRENYRGYIPLEFFTPNRHDGTSPPDSYEGFKLHWECPDDHPIRDESPLYGSNRWPTTSRGWPKWCSNTGSDATVCPQPCWRRWPMRQASTRRRS